MDATAGYILDAQKGDPHYTHTYIYTYIYIYIYIHINSYILLKNICIYTLKHINTQRMYTNKSACCISGVLMYIYNYINNIYIYIIHV